MGIGLTEEHVALAASVHGVAGRGADHAALAGQGLLGLHLPEDGGGQGFGLLESCVALEALGERRVGGAYLPAVLASAVLGAYGAELPGGTRLELLRGLAGGSLTAAVALLPGCAIGPAQAELFVVPAGDGGWAVLDRGDVTADPLEGIDPDRPLCSVTARDVPADRLLGAAPVRELAAVLLGADACGVAAWAVATAAGHARVREQFGRPIGQFQGVKHRVAGALVALEQARAAVWDAARALDEARGTSTTSSVPPDAGAGCRAGCWAGRGAGRGDAGPPAGR
ncbi:hypothetical protein GCM10020220_062900 [Nonomuraea rubra]|uniref:acyl-CoA dehydrogenase family protein n=1 Tax=Nonomuraea rubra TaxID=46180 RepID=UPI0031E863E6